MIHKKFSMLVIFVLLVSVLCVNAMAYATNGDWISSSEKITFVPHTGFGSTTKTHMTNAVESWNSVIGFSAVNMSSGTHNIYAENNNDDVSQVFRYNAGASAGYVGLCQKWVWSNGSVAEADIVLNTYYSFANSAQVDCYDAWSVFLHEVGHVCGLGDVRTNTSAVMYYRSSTNATKRVLTSDDIAGIYSIYGGGER